MSQVITTNTINTMPPFDIFKDTIAQQFTLMITEGDLFRVNIPKDNLWNTYLESFPPGSNPIFRKRTEFDRFFR